LAISSPAGVQTAAKAPIRNPSNPRRTQPEHTSFRQARRKIVMILQALPIAQQKDPERLK
jgi:hypothetical protein